MIIMVEKNIKTPKVFVSYSWTNEQHEKDVYEFISRLRHDGVDAIFDKTKLKEGEDKNAFMEQNLTSDEIDRILIILDEGYVKKANNRTKGAGIETQILSEQVYNNINQKKVIPIIWEHDENGDPYIPTYLSSRIYINLSDSDTFEEQYELLLRNLFDQPKFPETPLGNPPEEIFEKSPQYVGINSIIKKFNHQIDKNPDNINNLVNEFCEEFIKHLKELEIDNTSLNEEDQINSTYTQIEKYTPLRDKFILFFEKVLKTNPHETLDSDIIVDFLTSTHMLTTSAGWEHYNRSNIFHYDFILRELFLYLISIALKSRNYHIIECIIHSPYYFENNYREFLSGTFTDLDNRGHFPTNEYLNKYYINKHNKELISGIGELMKERVYVNYTMHDIAAADLLCCYISLLHADDEFKDHDWFPFTLPYYTKDYFDFFRKLDSKKYFEKVKGVLNVEHMEELKERIISVDTRLNKNRYGFGFMNNVEPISKYINLNNICTKR